MAIDAGHGPDTPGKRSPDDSLREFHFNSAVAKRVVALLSEYESVITLEVHEQGRDVPLKERTDRANKWKADAYVSIHANASGSAWSDANGIETFVYPSANAETRKLATNVHTALIDGTKRRDRGVKTADFHVLRETAMTAILVECGFMTNREECELLKADSYRDKVAQAIVDGIVKTYGLKRKEAVTVPKMDREAAEKVIAVLGALYMASDNAQVREAAHLAANALRDAAGIPRA